MRCFVMAMVALVLSAGGALAQCSNGQCQRPTYVAPSYSNGQRPTYVAPNQTFRYVQVYYPTNVPNVYVVRWVPVAN
jgi:hypothetical protein